MKKRFDMRALLGLALLLAIAGCNESPPAVQNAPNAPPASTPVVQTQPTQDKVALLPSGELLTANWMLVLDNSGSMSTTKCSGAESRMVAGGKAVVAFERQRPANDNFGLVVFTGQSPYARVAAALGRDRKQFEQEVAKASPDFQTPLGPAIELAYNELQGQLQKQGGYGTYHIVVVTDGEWNQGRDPVPLVKTIVQTSPVQIHVVGFCTGEGHRLNMPGFDTYANADNAEQINKGLQAVLAAENEKYLDQASFTKQ